MQRLLDRLEHMVFPCMKRFDAVIDRHDEVCENALKVARRKEAAKKQDKGHFHHAAAIFRHSH